MKIRKSTVLWILCIIYILSPLDLFPGPVDDAIVAFATTGITRLIK